MITQYDSPYTWAQAMTAVAALNGSFFEGVALTVDMWGKKPTA